VGRREFIRDETQLEPPPSICRPPLPVHSGPHAPVELSAGCTPLLPPSPIVSVHSFRPCPLAPTRSMPPFPAPFPRPWAVRRRRWCHPLPTSLCAWQRIARLCQGPGAFFKKKCWERDLDPKKMLGTPARTPTGTRCMYVYLRKDVSTHG
jgi:hypothetical protein